MDAWNAIVDDYLETLTGRTQENTWYDLRLWADWCDGQGLDPLSATRADLEVWLTEGLAAGRASRTVGTWLCHVAGVYRWAWETGVIGHDPSAGVRRPRRPRAAPRLWLGPEDLSLLLAESRAESPQVGALVHLLGLCGLRTSELVRARVEDAHSYDGRQVLHLHRAKNTCSQWMPLPAPVAGQVERAVGGRAAGSLLARSDGRPWSAVMIRRALYALEDELGLPHVTPQGLRVGAITLALRAGVDERVVMISAGHTSSAQTARYDAARTSVEAPAGVALAAWLDRLGEGGVT